MQTYRTAEVAKIIGIHPNTVRLYEKLKLIPEPAREKNRYRVFTDAHIAQFRLARLAFQVEVLQNGLRKKIVEMVQVSAQGNFGRAQELTLEYLNQVRQEQRNAEEAIEIVGRLLDGGAAASAPLQTRKEVSDCLGISMDSLRNWEMNGLLTVRRKENGYRVYSGKDIQRLKIIRALRCANYSLEAILRLLRELSADPNTNIETALNTPRADSDIISACDKLILSLQEAEQNALLLLEMLAGMKIQFG